MSDNAAIDRINTAADYIQKNSSVDPEMGLILGSGLGELGKEVKEASQISYAEIPGFQESTVEGHEGQLILGRLKGQSVYLMQGRFHYYEGHEPADLILPVQVMHSLSIHQMVVTNASGAINEKYDVGDLVVIEDHINFMGSNPLIGPNVDEIGDRFVDMTYAYSPELQEYAIDIGEKNGLNLQKGVYAATSGPSYETPAEVRMLRTVGADLVGMSTVPEVIAANHIGIEVLGISCVTNMAAGVIDQSLDHEEVIKATEEAKSRFTALVCSIISSM